MLPRHIEKRIDDAKTVDDLLDVINDIQEEFMIAAKREFKRAMPKWLPSFVATWAVNLILFIVHCIIAVEKIKVRIITFMRYFDWFDFIFKFLMIAFVIALIGLLITAMRAPSERASYVKLDKTHELVCVKKTGWGLFVEPYYEKCVNWLEVSK